MNKNVLFSLIILFIICSCNTSIEKQEDKTPQIQNSIGLVIHGGAGTILKKNMTPEKEAQVKSKLEEAIKKGYEILKQGGSSLDAVEQTIHILEDSPLFNAGKGAVFTNDEKNELDASIMTGKDLNAGAVAGVTTLKHPISAARLVMEKSPHVLLAREGAEQFALEQGLDTVSSSYFYTERRYKSLDKDGNLAAGTSTGGMTNKKWGRIGDSPVIGAGTYANNATCAVSATGHGEYFIRAAVAHDISALMEYKNLSLKEAAQEVIQNKLKKMGGDGGIIAIDAKGNLVMEFNTAGMYRASADENGNITVAIYKE